MKSVQCIEIMIYDNEDEEPIQNWKGYFSITSFQYKTVLEESTKGRINKTNLIRGRSYIDSLNWIKKPKSNNFYQ